VNKFNYIKYNKYIIYIKM